MIISDGYAFLLQNLQMLLENETILFLLKNIIALKNVSPYKFFRRFIIEEAFVNSYI